MLDLRVLLVLSTLTLGLAWCQRNNIDNLVVIQKPQYLTVDYSTQQVLTLNNLKNILLSLHGFTINTNVTWNGFKSTQPIMTPNATLIFLVDNKHFDVSQISNERIELVQDVPANFDYLKAHFVHTFGKENLVHTVTGLDVDLSNLKADCSSNPEIVYVFDVPTGTTENLGQSMKQVIGTFSDNCNKDNMLVLLLAVDKHQQPSSAEAVLSREARQAGGKKQASKPKQADSSSASSPVIGNEAVFYSDQYPAMFNLFFWSTLMLAAATYAIAYSLWYMDPGLDTVIYRMTSQRKKDN